MSFKTIINIKIKKKIYKKLKWWFILPPIGITNSILKTNNNLKNKTFWKKQKIKLILTSIVRRRQSHHLEICLLYISFNQHHKYKLCVYYVQHYQNLQIIYRVKKTKQNDNKMIYKLYTTWSTIHNLVGVGVGGWGWCLKINGENHKRWGMDHIDLQYMHLNWRPL